MSDSEFVDIPSPTPSPHILNPTISVSPRLVDEEAQMNNIDEPAGITTDRIPTRMHDFVASSGGDCLCPGMCRKRKSKRSTNLSLA